MEYARRDMSDITVTSSWPNPLLTPSSFDNDGHLSWNQVATDELQPFIAEAFKVAGTVDRAWDEEIIAVYTSGTSNVWRFCQHRTKIVGGFFEQPRPNVAQTGLVALFTSNWEDTLGAARAAVFAVELPVSTLGGTAISSTHRRRLFHVGHR